MENVTSQVLHKNNNLKLCLCDCIYRLCPEIQSLRSFVGRWQQLFKRKSLESIVLTNSNQTDIVLTIFSIEQLISINLLLLIQTSFQYIWDFDFVISHPNPDLIALINDWFYTKLGSTLRNKPKRNKPKILPASHHVKVSNTSSMRLFVSNPTLTAETNITNITNITNDIHSSQSTNSNQEMHAIQTTQATHGLVVVKTFDLVRKNIDHHRKIKGRCVHFLKHPVLGYMVIWQPSTLIPNNQIIISSLLGLVNSDHDLNKDEKVYLAIGFNSFWKQETFDVTLYDTLNEYKWKGVHLIPGSDLDTHSGVFLDNLYRLTPDYFHPQKNHQTRWSRLFLENSIHSHIDGLLIFAFYESHVQQILESFPFSLVKARFCVVQCVVQNNDSKGEKGEKGEKEKTNSSNNNSNSNRNNNKTQNTVNRIQNSCKKQGFGIFTTSIHKSKELSDVSDMVSDVVSVYAYSSYE